MNRFRTKKKAKDAATTEEIGRASTEDTPPMPKSSKTFRRKKILEPEPKIELDVANALPSSDDFRTSLLMSGLSARFSMLREQDDPNSKIGKASDDSVLFPTKRQSRLDNFAPYGLSDIAEVSSIHSSIRPPFAFGRADSFNTTNSTGTDDDSTHGGSVMSRPKPGEGNNLFGGRQKIYKIASGSTKSLADGGGGGMGGRALYDDDVSQSAFQKLREREREQERQNHEEIEHNEQNEQSPQESRPNSPSLSGYNRNRETSSTTSSGPLNIRTSTAATSITSQRTPSLRGDHTPVSAGGLSLNGLERSATKGRRLYETGLDKHLHDQQHSALSRIDTLTRQRNLGSQTPPPGLGSPTSASSSFHPADRWDRQPIATKASLPNLQAASPSPIVTPIGTFDFGVKPANTESKQPYGFAAPPLSPPMSENEENAVLPVQPNDRGKATALGTFQKPVQPYDDHKYSQRQLQMQQGRETTPTSKTSPPQAFMPRHQPPVVGRPRAESNVTFSSRSRSNSSAQRNLLPHDRIPESTSPRFQSTVVQENPIPETFLNSPNSSTGSGNEGEIIKSRPWANPQPRDISMYRHDQPVALQRPPESQHPANRSRPFESLETNGNKLNVPRSPGKAGLLQPPSPAAPKSSGDSPTLGPTTGLSGMIRNHLRSDSNSSSIYGAPSSNYVSPFPTDPLGSLDASPHNDYSTKSPWEVNDWDQDSYREDIPIMQSPIVPKIEEAIPPPLVTRPREVDGVIQDTRKPSWEKEIEAHHTRDGSTETQKEQDDFKAELATRRRRVQENLKSFVETESRSASPLPGVDMSKEVGFSKNIPLGLLRTKTSLGSLVIKQKDPSSTKAMKMLGLGNATISSSPSPSKQAFDENAWKEEEEEMLRNTAKPMSPPQTKAFRQARRDAQRDREKAMALRHQQKIAAEASNTDWNNVGRRPQNRQPSQERAPMNQRSPYREPSRERRPPPVTHRVRNDSQVSQESKASANSSNQGSRPGSRAARDRSSSDASAGRSKSRNAPYKDDLAKAMAEGTSSTGQSVIDDLQNARLMPKSPAFPNQPSPVPSPLLPGSARLRSESKSTASGYFDSQNLPPLQIAPVELGIPPRPSPVTPFSINATPALAPPSPATGSAATTPTSQAFQSQGRIPTSRKKSINKSEISEPTLISSTSRITTVNLPPGASLYNGSESAPPIPPVNPRRRQTRAMFGALMGKKDDYLEHSLPAATQSTEEMSIFSGDDDKPRRQKLRKSSSEGGNLNAKARQAIINTPTPSPPMPNFPSSAKPFESEGGMF